MGKYLQHKNWDEFRWEREIRRDELRINRYFFELIPCLDLPQEEEMIIEQLTSQSDLVPVGVANPSAIANWCYFSSDEDEDNDEDEDDNFQKTKNLRRQGDIVNQLDILASHWNMFATKYLSAKLFPLAMGITCAYGKLLARIADFIDADPKEDRALKLTLGKRVLADINILLDALSYLMIKEYDLQDFFNNQKEELILAREFVVDALTALWQVESNN